MGVTRVNKEYIHAFRESMLLNHKNIYIYIYNNSRKK